MYENMTFSNILKDALSQVSNDFDKRQGSIIYDALAPICAELAQAYIDLEVVLKQGFADTADRDYLIKRASERGIKPFEATYSYILANLEGDINLSGGERFNIDDVNFFFTGEMEEQFFKLKCEESGTKGNISYGELMPIDNIPNLEKATINSIFISAIDEEDTEIFRKRYFESFKNQSFGGNRADYLEKVNLLNELDTVSQNGGIGGIKVYRVPNGGGTVKVVITNNSYGIPTDELINIVQEEIDPLEYTGEGTGIAPIGHSVLIEPVKGINIDVQTSIELKSSYVIEDVKPYIEKEIQNYIAELCKTWQDSDNIVVRIRHIESAILDIQGIQDIRDTSINGLFENLTLDDYSIPIRGELYVN